MSDREAVEHLGPLLDASLLAALRALLLHPPVGASDGEVLAAARAILREGEPWSVRDRAKRCPHGRLRRTTPCELCAAAGR